MTDNLVVIAAFGTEKVDLHWPFVFGQRHPQVIVRTDMPTEDLRGTRMVATPYRGYDTGAFLYAFWNMPKIKRFLFVQDSLIPKDDYFADPFFEFDGPVLGWVGFQNDWWDSLGQQQTAKYAYPGELPPKMIFGPIFMATREALETLARKSLLPGIPNHKQAAQGKEREWAMAFQAAGIPVAFMHDFDTEKMQTGLYDCFAKDWVHRK